MTLKSKTADSDSSAPVDIGLSVSEVFIALASSDVVNLVTFYSGLLQMQPTVSTSAYAEFKLTNLKIAIFQPSADNAAEFEAAKSGSMSFCLEVSDLREAIVSLRSLDYPPPGEIMHTSHGQEVYAYDPDGNRLILHQKC